jgi:hypothetical protein
MLDKSTVREIALKYTAEVTKVRRPSAVILFGWYNSRFTAIIQI